MLHYAVVFFIIALIAAVFGFGGIAAGAAGIASTSGPHMPAQCRLPTKPIRKAVQRCITFSR